jgi:hypothetical protein
VSKCCTPELFLHSMEKFFMASSKNAIGVKKAAEVLE